MFETADSWSVEIDLVYVAETMGGVLQGTRQFVWRSCVDDVAADMARHWGSHVPVQVIAPPAAMRRSGLPPRWRIGARLNTWSPVKDQSADGSHMGLVLFREQIDDQPIRAIIAEAGPLVTWTKIAKDWCW